MVDHLPWKGSTFPKEHGGFLLIGFSHYVDDGPDHNDLTQEIIERHASSRFEELPFFKAIRSYFNCDDQETFWNSVAFANTLPDSVGDHHQKYSWGTREQQARVPARVRFLIEDTDPEAILVFSTKAWRSWPDFDFPVKLPLDGGSYRPIPWGSYSVPDSERAVTAFGLRHPQGAKWRKMADAVEAIQRHCSFIWDPRLEEDRKSREYFKQSTLRRIDNLSRKGAALEPRRRGKLAALRTMIERDTDDHRPQASSRLRRASGPFLAPARPVIEVCGSAIARLPDFAKDLAPEPFLSNL